MTLGETVKALRLQRKLSQLELARRAQITQATLSRTESNKILQLKSDALRRLATALGTTADYLLGNSDSLTPEEILRSDPGARGFIEIFAKLDAESRDHITEYVNFLVTARSNQTA